MLQGEYNQMLRESRNELEEFQRTGAAGSTGIDKGLPVKEMLELNKYMRTTASTNYPSVQFQPMFVCGWIWKKLVTPAVCQALKEAKINYSIGHATKDSYTLLDKHIVDNARLKKLAFEIQNRWVYDAEAVPVPNAWPSAKKLHAKMKISSPVQALRVKLRTGPFLETWASLTASDHKLLVELSTQAYNIEPMSEEECTTLYKQMAFKNVEKYDHHIATGNLLAATFEYTHDPTYRTLYQKLVKIFS